MSYSMNAIVLRENDLILGNLNDLLSVCEGIVWVVTSQLTQVKLWITFGERISCSCVYIIIGGLKDYLHVPKEGV